ncbi:MAG: hypothetical protein IJI60_02560 [Bacilli bacterium]|nr:hypothetical protein [Bacilli bacterium]
MEEFKELYTILLENLITRGTPLLEEVCPKSHQGIIQNLTAIPFERIKDNPADFWEIMARNLYQKMIDLYRRGTLRQYYVEDVDAIRIVCLLTGLSEEELVQITEERNREIRESFSQASKVISDVINADETPSNDEPIAVREEDLFGRAIQELLKKKKTDDENNTK